MIRSTPLARNRIAGAVFATVVLLMWVVANLPYRYVERDGVWYGRQLDTGDRADDSRESQPTMAGWPMRYSVRYELDDRYGSTQRYWSAPGLVINIALGLVVAGLVYGFTQLRRRVIETANNRQKTRAVFDAIIALAIVLVPITLYLLNYRKSQSQIQFARGIFPDGSVYLSCELPEPIAERVPSAWVSSLMRIRLVRLEQPDDRLLASTVQIPSLRGLWLGGDRYDFELLKPITSRIHLAALHIYRRELTGDDIQTIVECRWLRQLSLTRTNLDGHLLSGGLGQIVGLHEVDFSLTPLRLSELGKPAWADTVRTLALSRPKSGSGASLTIDGWPELRRLMVTRWSLTRNRTPLELRLSNLPNLTSLWINRVQCHALIVHDLPRLANIFENDDSMILALRERDDGIPGLTWFSELHLDGVASLKQIGCYATNLRSISIRNAPNLRKLEMGTFSVFGDGTAKIEPITAAAVQSWIDSLGQSDGPRITELNALPLEGVDLAPLANNHRLQELGLSNSGVSFDQLQGLAGMTQLTRLGIAGCRLKDGQLSWLFTAFPDLEQIRVDVSEVRNFDLSQAPNLDFVDATPFGNIRVFRLVDRPRLDSWFRLDRAPDRLEIRNAESLGGLEVRQPWPQDWAISGLRDLRSFVAGGKEVDDRVLDALLECRSLDRLTLAYPAVSSEKLCQIGRLTALSSIELPGAAVDDSVTENWHRIRMLHKVNLDDTNVSVGTLSWLSGIDSLRAVSLNRITFDQRASQALGNLVQLDTLQLANTSVPNESLMRILGEDVIERLDLSGNKIDSNMTAALARCTSLRHLKIHGCSISDDHVRQLLDSNPMLLVDLGDDFSGLGPDLTRMLKARYRSDATAQFYALRAAAKSYPKFELRLDAGDFMVYGSTKPIHRRQALDLTSFRSPD